jgi:hypothetical protein
MSSGKLSILNRAEIHSWQADLFCFLDLTDRGLEALISAPLSLLPRHNQLHSMILLLSTGEAIYPEAFRSLEYFQDH